MIPSSSPGISSPSKPSPMSSSVSTVALAGSAPSRRAVSSTVSPSAQTAAKLSAMFSQRDSSRSYRWVGFGMSIRSNDAILPVPWLEVKPQIRTT